MKKPQSPSERRLARATRGLDPALLRAASQRHLDARRERLEAYEAALIASLRVALQKDAAGANAARFERQLEQARKDLRNACRPRLPRVVPVSMDAPLDAPVDAPVTLR